MAKTSASAAAKAQARAAAREALLAKARETKSKEDDIRSQEGGSNALFISLVKDSKSPVINKKSQEYLEGAEIGSYYIGKRRLLLGTEFDATVLRVVELYQDSIKNGDNDSQTVGFWSRDDFEQLPADGDYSWRERSYIDKQGNMHVVSQCYWIVLYIHGLDEEFADVNEQFPRIQLNGGPSHVARDLSKLIKETSAGLTAELRFKVTSQDHVYKVKGKENFTLKPEFSLIGRNFRLTDDNIELVLEKDEDVVSDLLDKTDEVITAIQEHKLIRKRNVAGLLSAPAGTVSDEVAADDAVLF